MSNRYTSCRYCGGAGGKNVTREENCSKCNGVGRVPDRDKYVYCTRCFGRGTITATNWESCSCTHKAGCFPAGTLALTPFGQAEISTLRAGDKVKVYDSVKRAFVERRILKVLSYRERRSLRITLANRTCLHLTPNHNILSNGRWVRASTLRKGALVSTIFNGMDGDTLGDIEVVDIGDGNTYEIVYNPIVEDSFSLIANGVITHNFDRFKYGKMIYWNLIWTVLHSWQADRWEHSSSSG